MKPLVLAALCGAALVAFACGSDEAPDSTPPRQADSSAAAAPSSPPRPSAARPRIVILGDSLTAGLGLDPDEAFPARLQQRIDAARLDYDVVNAGISGDTSAGGLRRLDWALDGDVRILVLALGANDGLRGLSAEELARNLGQIIERAQARGVTVILAGMEAPPNFGPAYVDEFRKVYPDVAKKYNVALLPFLLDGVAGVSSLNQRDGIHPTAAGAERVADNVWAILKPIAEAKAGA